VKTPDQTCASPAERRAIAARKFRARVEEALPAGWAIVWFDPSEHEVELLRPTGETTIFQGEVSLEKFRADPDGYRTQNMDALRPRREGKTVL